MEKLTILGTGSAMVTNCYNTCFTISNNDNYFLIDAGGGNTILINLEKAGIKINQIKAMFISHTHSDHILGAPWVIRAIATDISKNKYNDTFTIYGEKSVIESIITICKIVLKEKFLNMFGKQIVFKKIKNKESFHILGRKTTFFDINSTKLIQFGFELNLKNNKRLTFIGDEPFNESEKSYTKDTDYLLHEAFCLYRDKDLFKPYDKHHATAKDAGINAKNLNVKNLIVYHTEDSDIQNRFETYSAEIRENFNGNIYVPLDFDIIVL